MKTGSVITDSGKCKYWHTNLWEIYKNTNCYVKFNFAKAPLITSMWLPKRGGHWKPLTSFNIGFSSEDADWEQYYRIVEKIMRGDPRITVEQYEERGIPQPGVQYGTNNGNYLFVDLYRHELILPGGANIYTRQQSGGYYGDLEPYPREEVLAQTEFDGCRKQRYPEFMETIFPELY